MPAKTPVSKATLQLLEATLSRNLHPHGVQVRVQYRDRHLHFLLEATSAPEELVYGPLIRQGFATLRSSAAWQPGQPLGEFQDLQGVILYGRALGQKQPAWTVTFDLEPSVMPSIAPPVVPGADAVEVEAVEEEGEILALSPEAVLAPNLFAIPESGTLESSTLESSTLASTSPRVPKQDLSAQDLSAQDLPNQGLPVQVSASHRATLIPDRHSPAPEPPGNHPPAQPSPIPMDPPWDLVEEDTALQEIMALEPLNLAPAPPRIPPDWPDSPEDSQAAASDRPQIPGSPSPPIPEFLTTPSKTSPLESAHGSPGVSFSPPPLEGTTPGSSPEQSDQADLATAGYQGMMAKVLLGGCMAGLLALGGIYAWLWPQNHRTLTAVQANLQQLNQTPITNLDQLQALRGALEENRDRLQSIPWIMQPAHGQAQNQLAELNTHLTTLQERQTQEEEASANLQEAKRLAAEAIRLGETNSPTDPAVISAMYDKWIAANYFLLAIPSQAWAFQEANLLRDSYRNALIRLSQLQTRSPAALGTTPDPRDSTPGNTFTDGSFLSSPSPGAPSPTLGGSPGPSPSPLVSPTLVPGFGDTDPTGSNPPP